MNFLKKTGIKAAFNADGYTKLLNGLAKAIKDADSALGGLKNEYGSGGISDRAKEHYSDLKKSLIDIGNAVQRIGETLNI